MSPHDTHLQIGSLLFEGIDQIDLTGPFEVLSRLRIRPIGSTARLPTPSVTSGDCGWRPTQRYPRRRNSMCSMCPAASVRKR